MLFNSPTYLVFFALLLVGYWSLPWHRARLVWLLAGSWIFYAAWYPSYLLLFLLVTGVNYGAAVAVGRAREGNPRLAGRIVTATVVLDLANLGVFKYFDFFVGSSRELAELLFGISWSAPRASLFLPLGISFYTFQMIAYVVDVRRGHCQVIRNPLKMSLFIAFFPQLIAGPIVRCGEFAPQLSSKRSFEPSRFLHGLDLIAIGLFKKVLVADQIAPFVDQVFAAPDGLGSATLLLAVYAYSIQIYCDFSGYTDIGRGCAYCLGYELPRNFETPYFSANIVAFWRRWHITLSSWLRDYLYIPLGGNRSGQFRTYLNLLITMTLGGLWHGASWTFVVWGMLHGLALALTRFVHEKAGVDPNQPLFPGRAYRIFSIVLTFHFVSFAWIFFRAQTFDTAFTMLAAISNLSGIGRVDVGVFGFVTLGLTAAAVAALGSLHLSGAAAVRGRLHQTLVWTLSRPLLYAGVAVGLLLFASRGAQQFIYFQF